MSRTDTALLVIDVQEKLAPHVRDSVRMIWNIRRLIDAAELLGMPRLVTEQYPKGLGGTIPDLAAILPKPSEKVTFSCGSCGTDFSDLQEQGIHKVLVTGIEAHVCVQQTVFDLMAGGFQPYIAVDAVSSRFSRDEEVALRRMESGGATITTTESALFEWCETAAADEFKAISKLVREEAPAG